VVQSHLLAAKFTDRLFETFDDADISWDAAKAIGDIAGSDLILTRQNHAIVKVELSPHTLGQ
jgi:DNA repair/transcription protein MET18/MMS19